uniref:Dynein assembly factor 3, axonemal homolog n=1 Tax=Stomoxys calcitrans TaxID=35570 RepID=A0A1I8NZB0_STOCA
MFWGLSEALDLFQEYIGKSNYQVENENLSPDSKNQDNTTEINILLFGSNDPRHILATMANMYSHRAKGINPVINFYLVDGCIEIVARNIALLAIALENPKVMNIRSKTHLFMDIYGNTLVRAFSHQYVSAKSKSLIKTITDSQCLEKKAPFLNIDGLKYRERDGVENALNFWSSKEGNIFNIKQYWNERVKKLLGTRYDYREGQFDWDLNMVLKDRKGSQICSQEYRHWRETGVAFTFPEFEYNVPNKTLAAGLVRNGKKYLHRGYIGDIQTGPYAAFGLTTSDQRMLKSMHGQNDYRSTDITERNILQIFHELATQMPYDHDLSQSRKYGSIRLQMGKGLTNCEEDVENLLQDYNEPWIKIEGVKINFLSSDEILSLQDSNSRWANFFDVIFVAHNYFSFLKDSFIDVLRSPSILIMETRLLTTERKSAVDKFEEELFQFAERTHLKPCINYDTINSKRSILKFQKI